MSDDSRTNILQRLEAGLGTLPYPGCLPAPDSIPSPLPDAASVAVQHGPADWRLLRTELTNLRAELDVATTRAELAEALKRLVRAYGIETAVCWEHSRLAGIGIDVLLAAAGVKVLDAACVEGSGACRALRDVDLGVTAADAVFLDCGAIAVRSGIGRPRSISLVPRVHLAVVAEEDLQPGLHVLPELLRAWGEEEGGLPSAIHLISGPSGTADIELVYVQGVHGPLALHVLALSGDWAGAEGHKR